VFALPLALTRRRERPFYLAAFAAVGGLAFTGATALGGALASALPDRLALPGLTIHNLQVLFVLSGLLRFAAAFLTVHIHEPSARGVGELFSAIAQRLGQRPVAPPAAALVPAPVPVPVPDATAAPPASDTPPYSLRPPRRRTRSQIVPVSDTTRPGPRAP
jgi:hypothetical protein